MSKRAFTRRFTPRTVNGRPVRHYGSASFGAYSYNMRWAAAHPHNDVAGFQAQATGATGVLPQISCDLCSCSAEQLKAFEGLKLCDFCFAGFAPADTQTASAVPQPAAPVGKAFEALVLLDPPGERDGDSVVVARAIYNGKEIAFLVIPGGPRKVFVRLSDGTVVHAFELEEIGATRKGREDYDRLVAVLVKRGFFKK